MIRILQKSIFALAICGATLCSFAANAKPYMNADALPNALNFYPAPPETTSVQFMYDISQYMWGKAMRADSARAALAIAQAETNLDTMVRMFSKPFGMEISAKKTPAIMNVIERGIATLRQVGRGIPFPIAGFGMLPDVVGGFIDHFCMPGHRLGQLLNGCVHGNAPCR